MIDSVFKVIQGLVKLRGGTDATIIGNTSTGLHVVGPAGPLSLETTQAANGVLLGPVNETAPATDTASSGLNGRQQRIAQRLTALIGIEIPSAGGTIGFSDGQITASAISVVNKTTYTEQTVNAQRSVVSGSASDTAAGSGARTLKITYYDDTLAGPFTETLTLNGVTPVNTVGTNICFIERMDVLTGGSFGGNIGILSLKAAPAGGGVTLGTIAAGDNQTLWCHHYVAAGKTMVLRQVTISAGQATGATFAFIPRNPLSNGNMPQRPDQLRVANSATTTRAYVYGKSFVGPMQVRAFVTPDATSTTWFAAMEYYDI